jgi:hypothetical protein
MFEAVTEFLYVLVSVFSLSMHWTPTGIGPRSPRNRAPFWQRDVPSDWSLAGENGRLGIR